MTRTLCGAALALTLLGLAGATGQVPAKAEGDQQFVLKASASGLAEVNLANMALKQANEATVKKFAEMMAHDHSKANKELLALADKKKMTAATRMDAEHEKAAAELAKLTGAAFDREYMAGQVKDHKEAVALFETEAKEGRDEDLKAWAEKTLPTLRDHLKMAEETRDKVKTSK